LAHPDGGLVIVANHGLFGAETWLAKGASTPRSVRIDELDPAGSAAVGELLGAEHVAVASASGGQVIEAWPSLEGDRPLWRQGLPKWPDASWVHGRRVGVHAERWQVFDLDSGVLVADVPGTRGACVIGDRLFTHRESTLTSLDLASGAVETTTLVLPEVAYGCRVHEGAPVFHGLGTNGDGWLQGPGFALLSVPGWDLNQAASIGEGPSPWWIAVPYQHVGVVDPGGRKVRIEKDVATTVSSGSHRFWTRLDPAHRRQTLVSGEAERELVARTVPTADHVDQGVVWTFPNYARGDAARVQRFRLPTLEPFE
jgi:hypothetical protein